MRNWFTATQDILKELELFYVDSLILPLFILWDWFITVHVIHKTRYHWMLLNVMFI